MTKKKLHRAHNLTTKDAIDDAMVDIDTMTSPVFMELREALVFLAQIKAGSTSASASASKLGGP